MLPSDATERKNLPLYSGFMKYFPDAMAAVAKVSKLGNDQHNPGEPLHWSREKSSDHEDCLARHLLGLGTLDDDGQLHSAKLAWRAMALLQLECEARAASGVIADAYSPRREADDLYPLDTALKSVPSPTFLNPSTGTGDTVSGNVKMISIETNAPKAYLAGPMTGFPLLNFPAFDEAQEVLEELGWDVISPVELDREFGIDEHNPPEMTPALMKVIIQRDITAILSLDPVKDAIAMMPGWEKSKGATAELFFARWYGLDVIGIDGDVLEGADIDYARLCTHLFGYLKGFKGPS